MDRRTGRPAAGRPGAGAGSAKTKEPASQPLKGFVKGGVVHLLEGELPDGMFVKVTPDRQ
jgi:probable phosphoglycerate mutase